MAEGFPGEMGVAPSEKRGYIFNTLKITNCARSMVGVFQGAG
jgi:hypothetical protein